VLALVVVSLLLGSVLLGCGDGQLLGRDAPYPALDVTEISPGVDPESGLRWVRPDDLPSTARATITLVEAGGTPPTSAEDRVDADLSALPEQPAGYYRPYPVPSADGSDGGSWYLVFGAGGEVFWTTNDFDSVRRVQR
jgi:ribonuclease T1